MKIKWRNLPILAAVTIPIGFIIGHYVVDDTSFWWVMAIALGLLLGLFAFKIRETDE